MIFPVLVENNTFKGVRLTSKTLDAAPEIVKPS
jgi:hypothetical protein